MRFVFWMIKGWVAGKSHWLIRQKTSSSKDVEIKLLSPYKPITPSVWTSTMCLRVQQWKIFQWTCYWSDDWLHHNRHYTFWNEIPDHNNDQTAIRASLRFDKPYLLVQWSKPKLRFLEPHPWTIGQIQWQPELLMELNTNFRNTLITEQMQGGMADARESKNKDFSESRKRTLTELNSKPAFIWVTTHQTPESRRC